MYISTVLIYIILLLQRGHCVTRGGEKKQKGRDLNLANLVDIAKQDMGPSNFMSIYGHHASHANAVFAAAIDSSAMPHDAERFAGTLRATGYRDDIVVAIAKDARKDFVDVLRKHKCVIYAVEPKCIGQSHDTVCKFEGQARDEHFSINMIRFNLYKWWSRHYSSESLIMFTDFRDVFFQMNPFLYNKESWQEWDMQVFLEHHPSKVIERCPFNRGWIEECYGTKAIEIVGTHTVSCSGVSIGKRDPMLAYAHLMLSQLEPDQRNQYKEGFTSTTENPKRCISLGMDQGLHNWLLYSGQLSRYFHVKIVPQGEGLVNTLGSLKGDRAPIKMTLEEWGILKADKNGATTVHNWDGHLSPVVHQADRWSNEGTLYETLKVFRKFKNLKKP